ncbi:MAG: SDR family NAD(P)-dependent oxidoreductase [Gemmatimonadota bacterium]
MRLRDKICVVTGGASGIGRAISRKFAAEGAHGVVADLDGTGAETVAREVAGVAMPTDVRDEAAVRALILRVEREVGPIDLVCNNAGIAIAGGPEVPTAGWQRMWEINVMSHVWTADAALPAMLARGAGYFVNVASAAGLITQVGSAPYAVTKHAAVAFAEWLTMTYGERGIRVSCVCPLGVRTPMLHCIGGDKLTALLSPDAIEPEEVALAIVAGIEREEFLVLPHPKVREFVRRKWDDNERWLKGMRRLNAEYGPGAVP